MSDYPDPTRVVADTDVLAADLLVGGSAREAIDMIRTHDFLSLITTDTILLETHRIIETLTEKGLADDWLSRARRDFPVVEPDGSGQPAIEAAAASNAATVLSLEERLLSTQAGLTIRDHVATSVRSPRAFVAMVDPAALKVALEEVNDTDY